MLPVNCGSHADYQHFVVTNFRKYYPDPDALARSTWDIIERFWNLDLSFTDTFMADKYSKFGPTPRTPSCMQRSYLLSIDFKVTSLTEWAAQLKMNPLYAILSGFEPGNTPGVGTFYDFINRLWNSDYTQFFLKKLCSSDLKIIGNAAVFKAYCPLAAGKRTLRVMGNDDNGAPHLR